MSVSTDNPALITNLSISNGTPGVSLLSYTPGAGLSGSATITVTATDDGGIGNGGDDDFVQSFIVLVEEVNDEPFFDPLADITIQEDAGLQQFTLTGITAGAGEDGVQTIAFNGRSLNTTLISTVTVGPIVGQTAQVSFTPNPNASGTATIQISAIDDGGTANDGDDTFFREFVVTVNAVADQPNLVANNVSGNEDTPIALDVISSLVDVDGSESLTVVFDGIPPGAILSGSTLTPPPNFNGIMDLTARAIATEASNGDTAQRLDAFTVTVNPVNDEPSFDTLNNLTLNEDAPKQDINIKGVVPGPLTATDENVQKVTVTAVSSNQSVIPNPTVSVVISGQAVLSFTPAPGASGVVDIVVTAKDDGGTANGGDDIFTRTFTVTINDVNDKPSFDPLNDLTFDEDPGPKTFTVKNISAGLNDVGQTVTMTAVSDNPALIPNPTMTAVVGGQSTMNFTATANATGTATITVTAQDDGGTANGGDDSFSRIMKITINAVADQPNLTAANVSGNEDTVISLNIVSSLVDTDGSESLSIVVSGIPNGFSLSAGVAAGGNVTLTQSELSGLTLTPLANFNGVLNLTATATATEGANGSSANRVAPFTVTVNPVNDAPIANAQVVSTPENTPISIVLTGSDPDGDPITFTLNGFPTRGFLNGAPPNMLYTPNSNFSGTDTFGFQTRDSSNTLSARAVVTVNVLPVCGNGNVTTIEDCDDGNTNSGDGCSNVCEIEFCGDGVTNNVTEECDDGNGNELDGCTSQCVSAVVCDADAFPVEPLSSGLFAVDPATGHCYIGATQPIDWFSAESICEQNGGTLAVPDTIEENAFILTVRPSVAEMWIGINDINVEAGTNGNAFVEVTGDLVSLNNFRPGEPNSSGDEDCVHFGFNESRWNDFSCGNALDHFVCEFEKKTTFSELFEQFDEDTTEQCNAWNDFRADLNGSFTRVTIRSDLDPIGVSCTGIQANNLCGALHNATEIGPVVCDGRSWSVGLGCSAGRFPAPVVEISANGDFCNCSDGYIARPCIGNSNWGGATGGVTCGAQTQTIEVLCE
jgi:cysteine-rich repeat protein